MLNYILAPISQHIPPFLIYFSSRAPPPPPLPFQVKDTPSARESRVQKWRGKPALPVSGIGIALQGDRLPQYIKQSLTLSLQDAQ